MLECDGFESLLLNEPFFTALAGMDGHFARVFQIKTQWNKKRFI